MIAPNSSRVRIHTPSGVVLPESSPLERRDRDLPAYGTLHSDAEVVERPAPDTRTLLYDLFRSPDGRKLHAIGPDPRNLSDEMGTPTISVEGQRLRHRARIEGVLGKLNPKTRLLFLEADLPEGLAARDQLQAELKWRNFTATATINPALPTASKPLMTLTTIQKDYPLEWIRDWALYHHRTHGVERVVLYDNDSDDFDALREGLAELDEGLRVELIKWAYPFGLPMFRYCQQGALNHCHLRFGGDTSYFLNFDLDEYLANVTGAPLEKYLARHLRGRTTTLLTTQYLVPNLPTAPPTSGPPRARNFQHRNRTPHWHNPHRTKTIFTPRNITFVGNHDTNPRMPRWLARLANTNARLARHLAGPRLAWLPTHRRRRVPVSELYFNHYQGINTGWKFAFNSAATPDPAREELDPVLPQALEKAGLG